MRHCGILVGMAAAAHEGMLDGAARTRVSRAMTWLLRHGLDKCGVEVRPDGYIPVERMLREVGPRVGALAPALSEALVREIVRTCPKQRFGLREEAGVLLIRANQGHTAAGIDSAALLTPVTAEEAARMRRVVHGTTEEAWASIAAEGLRRMSRMHVHFAQLDADEDAGAVRSAGDRRVHSGLRQNAAVHVHLDVAALVRDGVPVWRSENGVILCSGVGDTGIIPLRYIQAAVRTRDGHVLHGALP